MMHGPAALPFAMHFRLSDIITHLRRFGLKDVTASSHFAAKIVRDGPSQCSSAAQLHVQVLLIDDMLLARDPY
jgi:hypothetical protein